VLSLRRHGGDRAPLTVEFSPALPLGAQVSGTGSRIRRTPGDVHVSLEAQVVDSSTLTVSYRGGWTFVPPVMPPAIGARSSAPRVLSERLGEGRGASYLVALEGLAGRPYTFRVGAPDPSTARRLAVRGTNGATLVLSPASGPAGTRAVTVTFPRSGADADGYTTTTLTFSPNLP